MRFRERRNEEKARPADSGSAAPGGAGLDQLREETERLLAAGDAAIEHALSGDSEKFLAANRQRGGQ
jgi:hypothetical protein